MDKAIGHAPLPRINLSVPHGYTLYLARAIKAARVQLEHLFILDLSEKEGLAC
jgi:hypothetical protein